MANPLRGEASFEVDGKTHTVRFNWNAAAAYEEKSGRNLSEALVDLARERLSARSLRAMLWAGLTEFDDKSDLTLADAGRLLDKLGRREAQRIMGVALRYFFPELEEADPPKPATSG